MADEPDVNPPDLRQVARDAAALLRHLRHDGPKTLPQTDPEEDR